MRQRRAIWTLDQLSRAITLNDEPAHLAGLLGLKNGAPVMKCISLAAIIEQLAAATARAFKEAAGLQTYYRTQRDLHIWLAEMKLVARVPARQKS